ncbi:hypothetical protein [Streptococcus sp. UBA632]|nr:hypothetical protein [Streptococcus sp. UBA632]
MREWVKKSLKGGFVLISPFVLKLPLVLTLAFLVGMLAVIFLQGQ